MDSGLRTMFERIPASSSQEPAGAQVCAHLHRSLHTSLLSRLPTAVLEREPAVPGENLVLHQTLVHCPAPDQVCHHEEIGSNGRGSQDQARRARVQAALPDSLLEACTQVALNVDLGVPGAQSVRYFRTAVPLPALGLSPMSRSGSWLVSCCPVLLMHCRNCMYCI